MVRGSAALAFMLGLVGLVLSHWASRPAAPPPDPAHVVTLRTGVGALPLVGALGYFIDRGPCSISRPCASRAERALQLPGRGPTRTQMNRSPTWFRVQLHEDRARTETG
jgi:hypothetical protein